MQENQRIQAWIVARYGGLCARCSNTFARGEKIVHGTSRGVWCSICAENPIDAKAGKRGNCARTDCGYEYKEGEQGGWAPRIGQICYYCFNGKDSGRARLTDDERQRLDQTVDRVSRLSVMGKRSPELEREYRESLVILKNEFFHIAHVKRLLERCG